MRKCTDEGGNAVLRAALPQHLHCFPTTPEHGFHVARAPAHRTPVWVSLQLLDLASLQQWHWPTLAIHALVDSLLDHHRHNGSCEIGGKGSISQDQFRKLFSTALSEFQNVEFDRRLQVKAVARASEPAGGRLPAPCIACGKQPHSTYAMPTAASRSRTIRQPGIRRPRSEASITPSCTMLRQAAARPRPACHAARTCEARSEAAGHLAGQASLQAF